MTLGSTDQNFEREVKVMYLKNYVSEHRSTCRSLGPEPLTKVLQFEVL